MMRYRNRWERGQVLIVFVLAMTVIFAMGAVAVDLGLWISERRGAQKDADAVSLAGAWELLDFSQSDAQNQADALAAANAYLAVNEQGSETEFAPGGLVVDDSCFGVGSADAVTADVNHSTEALFASIFNVVAPVPGAHAKACAGAIQAPGDVVPFHVTDNPGPCFDTNEQPLFTSLCPVENGAHGGNPNRGLLDLEAGIYCSNQGGNGDPEELIENGAQGLCLIDEDGACDGPNDNTGYYDCVFAQAGNTGQVLDGVYNRVINDGKCDTNFGDGDGTDEFFESVTKVFNTGNDFTSIYEARDCDPLADGLQKSPRVVTIIVLEEDADQNDPSPIIAFAGFFLAGCGDERLVWTSEVGLDPDCDVPGPGGCPPGHCTVFGRFVKLIVAGGDVGPPTDQTTLFGIGLVE